MKTFIVLFVLFILNVNVLRSENLEIEFKEQDENSLRSLISLVRLKKSYCNSESIPEAFESNCTEFLNRFKEIGSTKNEKYCYCNDINNQDVVYWCSCCDDLIPIDDRLLNLYKSDNLSDYFDWLMESNVNNTLNYDYDTCEIIKIEKNVLNLNEEIEFVKSKTSEDHFLNFYSCIDKSEFREQFLSAICEMSLKSQLELIKIEGEEYHEEEIRLDLPDEYSSN